MKKFSHCLLICILNFINIFSQELSSQQNPLLNNLYNLNPAAAGFDGAFISQISYLKSWLGISGAPTYQVLSNSVRLGDEEFYDPNMFINKPLINLANRVGLGLTVFNQSSGPLNSSGVLLAYAYHFPILDGRLSFGISGSLAQNKLNTRDFKPKTTDDPSLYNETSAIIPDVNTGVMFYNSTYYYGISANGLLYLLKSRDKYKSFCDFYAYGGYRIKVNPMLKLEPSLFLKAIEKKLCFDFNSKLYIRNKCWFLISYQNFNELLTGFSFNMKKGIFQVGYFYGIYTNGLTNILQGGQNFSLRVDVTRLLRKH